MPRKSKPKTSTDGDDNGGNKTSPKVSRSIIPTAAKNDRYVIALLLIIPAFLIIAAILGLQWGLVATNNEMMTKIGNNQNITQADRDKQYAMIDANRESYETIINILIPVFAAWVSAVVAFYFGSKQAEEAQKSLQAMTESLREGTGDDLEETTVEDLIEEFPDSKLQKEVTKASINEIVDRKFEKKIQEYGYVRVYFEIPKPNWDKSLPFKVKSVDAYGKPSWKDVEVDPSFIEKQQARDKKDKNPNEVTADNQDDDIRQLWDILINRELPEMDDNPQYYDEYDGKTIGILYLSDFYDNDIENLDEYIKEGKHTLGQLIMEGKPNDLVTNKVWSIDPTKSVENFGEIYLTESLRVAKTRMEDIGTNPDFVKGLALDDEDNVRAIISNYLILSHL